MAFCEKFQNTRSNRKFSDCSTLHEAKTTKFFSFVEFPLRKRRHINLIEKNLTKNRKAA